MYLGNLPAFWIFLILFVPVLFYTSKWFRYNAKIFVYYFLVLFVSGISAVLCLQKPGDVENHKYGCFFLRHIRKLFGIKYVVQNQEKANIKGPYIVVSNHQSSLDLFTMSHVWPHRCASMAKRSLMYAGPLGAYMYLMGTVFINRFKKEDARNTMQDTIKNIKDNNITVWVFPEGTRNHDGSTMLPFKKGAFHLGIQAQIPIVPVVFSSYATFYDKRSHKFDNGATVTIKFLDPISTQGLTSDDVTELTERTRDVMLQEFYKISPNVSSPPNGISKQATVAAKR